MTHRRISEPSKKTQRLLRFYFRQVSYMLFFLCRALESFSLFCWVLYYDKIRRLSCQLFYNILGTHHAYGVNRLKGIHSNMGRDDHVIQREQRVIRLDGTARRHVQRCAAQMAALKPLS